MLEIMGWFGLAGNNGLVWFSGKQWFCLVQLETIV